MKASIIPNVESEMETNIIYNCDCVEGMAKLPDNSVDIVIADPPYNLSKGTKWSYSGDEPLSGMGGAWKKVMEKWDDMSLVEYMNFTQSWLKQVKRVLKPSGSVWIFGTYHNLGIINVVCQVLKIEIINEVVWYKRNAFPNLSGRRLTASHESILWAHTGEKKREYFFDYDFSKQEHLTCDSLKAAGKQMRTVWDIPNNKSSCETKWGNHPTQKPVRVLTRMIRLAAKPYMVMLTPFAGAGSECVAAKLCGLAYIGYETDREYYNLAQKRLTNVDSEIEALGGLHRQQDIEAGRLVQNYLAL